MNEEVDHFLKKIHDASSMLGVRKQEPYVPPSPEQIKSSLIAMRQLLDGTSDNVDAQIAMLTSKWREKMFFRSTAEERVALANDLYILAAGRNANLELEAPEIGALIRYEYRPLEKNATMIRKTRPPTELLRIGIQAQLKSLNKQQK